MVDIAERTSVVKVKDFDPKELHPEYRGWRSDCERAEISLTTTTALVRSGKVDQVVLAQQPVDGPFGILALGKDSGGKLFLLERKRSAIDRDVFIEEEKKRCGKQRVEVRVVTSDSQTYPQQERLLTDFVDSIEQYKAIPGATMLNGRWEDTEWDPTAKYRAIHEVVVEKNQYGWVERWGIKRGFPLAGKKIPVTRAPIEVMGGSK